MDAPSIDPAPLDDTPATGRELRAMLHAHVRARKGSGSHDAYVWAALEERDELARKLNQEMALCDEANANLTRARTALADLTRSIAVEREVRAEDARRYEDEAIHLTRRLQTAIETCATLRAERDRLTTMLATADEAIGRASTLSAWAFGAVVLAFIVGAVIGAVVA